MDGITKDKRLYKNNTLDVTIIGLLFSLALLVSALLMIFNAIHNQSEYHKILDSGVRSNGTIIDKYKSGYDDVDYKISYTFYTGEYHLQKNTKSVPYSQYSKFEIGSLIEIAYNPGRPEKNFPINWNPNYLGDTFLAVLIGGFGLWALYNSFRRVIKVSTFYKGVVKDQIVAEATPAFMARVAKCHQCKYADKEALKKIEPWCNAPTVPSINALKCRTFQMDRS